MLIETDAPYLAPVPMRGRRNEPSFVPHVCAKMAELHGLPDDAVAAQTSENFSRLFKIL
jgi:TatD DNase family protein